MLVHFVVISVFDRDNHRAAKLGPKDPNQAHQSVAATLRLAGVTPSKELDPMWHLVSGNKLVGYVKVFREERYARNWFRDLKERRDSRNFWAFWRDGYPLALIEGANAKDANQFVNYQALCRVRAFSAQSAAQNGWDRWISGNLTAIEVDLDDSRDPRTVGKEGRETTTQSSSREATSPFSVDYSEWQVAHGASDIGGPRPNDELSRTYELSGLAPPDQTATFRIVCKLQSQGLNGGLEAEVGGLKLHRQLCFYLRPFRLPHDAEFVMGLSTVNQLTGGEFDVLASPVDHETSVFAKFGGRNDVKTCFEVIASGDDMIFTIADKSETLVKLRLPNDAKFKRLVDESCDRLAQTEVMYEIVRSQPRR
ncbi:MAG: hypothetical protein J0H17_02705 [Rhizobiales bacterium]|nr:hypothetical protein [Hyphomicrobiales bacterium]